MQLTQSSVGRKIIMAVTGFVLVAFVCVHLLGNSSLFFGADAINAYAQKLHSLGPFVWVFRLVMLAALLAPMTLGGWAFSFEALQPKLSKLDPIKGLKRVFSAKGLMELLKSLGKFVLVAGATVTSFLWTAAAVPATAVTAILLWRRVIRTRRSTFGAWGSTGTSPTASRTSGTCTTGSRRPISSSPRGAPSRSTRSRSEHGGGANATANR